MPYTKTGVFYTAKPGPPKTTSTKARYGGGYMGGPKYQPGYYAQKQAYNYAQLVKPETKYFDVGINTAVTWNGGDWADSEVPADNYVNSSGAAAAYTDSALIPTAQGSGYGQVDGNKYKLKKIRVKGKIRVPSLAAQSTAAASSTVRLMLVEDTQPNGAQAQGEDVMQDVGVAAENIHTFMRVANNLGRFRILKDKTWILNPATLAPNTDAGGTIVGAYNGVSFKWAINFAKPVDVSIKAGNATPTIAGTINRNYFLLLAGLSGSDSATAIQINAVSRAYYCD